MCNLNTNEMVIYYRAYLAKPELSATSLRHQRTVAETWSDYKIVAEYIEDESAAGRPELKRAVAEAVARGCMLGIPTRDAIAGDKRLPRDLPWSCGSFLFVGEMQGAAFPP